VNGIVRDWSVVKCAVFSGSGNNMTGRCAEQVGVMINANLQYCHENCDAVYFG
jgi:hypothetical protein